MSAREVDYGGSGSGWAEPRRWRPDAIDIVFVAALEREVSCAVRGWTRTTMRVGRSEQRMYFDSLEQAAVVCAGTGYERAYRVARACIEEFSPRVVISLGFAGACVPELGPGAIVVPERVVVPEEVPDPVSKSPDESYGAKEFSCVCGTGALASVNSVASGEGKRQVRLHYGAVAVEMEAAGVAAAAAEYGREFAAIKAISDGVEENLDFLSPFVIPGGFAMRRFLAYVAVRPRLWRRIAVLERNSKLAAAALEPAVIECIGDWPGFVARHSQFRKAGEGNRAAGMAG